MRLRAIGVSICFLLSLAGQACESSDGSGENEDEASEAAESDSDSSVADLIPGEDHYSLVHIDIGGLAFSLDTIETTVSGALVKLQVGNTTGAGLEALSATVQWGPPITTGGPQTSPERTRELPLASLVPAGKWTHATFTLTGVSPSDVGFIRLSNVDYTGLVLK